MTRPRFVPLQCAILALALLLAACSHTEPPAEKTSAASLSLWAQESGALTQELERRVERYNAAVPETAVELRLFSDEQSLADAMDSARPDLLLCRADHALALYGQDRLNLLPSDDAPLPRSSRIFRELSECVGASYFPLCADVQLLAADPAVPGQNDAAVLSSMERLCTAASESAPDTDIPFFAADSYAALFAVCLAQSGEDFHARRSEDIRSEAYRRLYNHLAGAAYNGGLVWEAGDLLPALLEGRLSCLLSTATRLAGHGDALLFYPMPVVQGGQKLCLAEIWGVAVTSPFDDSLPGAAAFLRWLCGGALDSGWLLERGWLPAAEGPWPEKGGSFVGALRATADSYSFFVPALDSGYRLQGAEFEEDFRAALALLR